MRKSKKIVFCICLFIMVAIFGIINNIVDTEDGEMPTFIEHTGTDSYADKNENDKENNPKENDTKDDDEILIGDILEQKNIDEILNQMTIEEKVGQLFFIKNDGRFDESILAEYPVGGIILFAGDFISETPESLTDKIQRFQDKSAYPLLIGTDEEGGSVVRISKFSALADKQFLSPRSLYASGGYDSIERDTHDKSKLLSSYGINVNFAPVCDVSNDYNDFIYYRSFGRNAEETATYVTIVVTAMNEENMGSVLKHFPGYGNNGDTHKNIIFDKRDYKQFENVDFVPFKAGIAAGGDCILVSHNIVECIDNTMPASLSNEMNRIIREELDFNGVIITDDLMMDGVSNFVSDEESAVMAILAGNDMVLSTDFQIQYNSVLQAVNDGRITEERLDESIERILRWKKKLGLIEF